MAVTFNSVINIGPPIHHVSNMLSSIAWLKHSHGPAEAGYRRYLVWHVFPHPSSMSSNLIAQASVLHGSLVELDAVDGTLEGVPELWVGRGSAMVRSSDPLQRSLSGCRRPHVATDTVRFRNNFGNWLECDLDCELKGWCHN